MAVHAQIVQSEAKVPAKGLHIAISQQGASTTIALDGEWDLAERETTRHAFREALARRPGRVVLDLSRLTFMDSSGVHAVRELAIQADRLQIDLVVIPGPRAVQRVFELCQVTGSVRFVDRA